MGADPARGAPGVDSPRGEIQSIAVSAIGHIHRQEGPTSTGPAGRNSLCTGGQRMSRTPLAAVGGLSFSGQQLTTVVVAIAIALIALGFAAALVRAVLATGQGTK